MIQKINQFISNHPVALIFFKTETCAPCKDLLLKVTQMTDELNQVKLMVVNADEYPEAATHLNVFSSPAILVFFEKREYIRKGVYTSVPELQNEIERYLELMK